MMPATIPREHSFSPAARWLWLAGDASPRNTWAAFRRGFDLPATEIGQAYLLVTADSRYEVAINGTHVGRGPVRSFPFAYGYDVYEVGPLLRPGEENVVAALVVHWGDTTMHYIRGRGGFLCELVVIPAEGETILLTGSTGWQARRDSAFTSHTPRISVQLPFEEQYDARQEVPGWRELGFDGAAWDTPIEVGPVGCAPWTTLLPRGIPFLSEDPLAPVRVLAAELARVRQGTWWSLDLRHLEGCPGRLGHPY